MSKRALVAWDRDGHPKIGGGLNVIAIEVWNNDAIYKLFWNIAQKKDKLWVKKDP